jgi:SAM-dependent methyltransferase
MPTAGRAMIDWGEDLAKWWLGEVASDPAYASEVLPLASRLLDPRPGCTYLDLGCGDGGLMAAIAAAGAVPVGVDASAPLAGRARASGAVVLARLPDIGFLGDGTVDGVAVVLVLEHLPEVRTLFAEAARVTRRGGALAVVVNHPLMTAPGSGPFLDPEDGEVLWRWGRYLDAGSTTEPAGEGTVVFHHHTLGHLLSEAAAAGWSLSRIEERPVLAAWMGDDSLLRSQDQVPRLLGARWLRGTGASP